MFHLATFENISSVFVLLFFASASLHCYHSRTRSNMFKYFQTRLKHPGQLFLITHLPSRQLIFVCDVYSIISPICVSLFFKSLFKLFYCSVSLTSNESTCFSSYLRCYFPDKFGPLKCRNSNFRSKQ